MACSPFHRESEEFANSLYLVRNRDSKALQPEVGHVPTKNALPATNFPLQEQKEKSVEEEFSLGLNQNQD